MSKPLQEKLKIVRFIPENAKRVLDVGCADGTITLALANMFPNIEFVGLDINKEFIEIAKSRIGNLENVSFECKRLHERLLNPEKFDVVLFCSVLHEFFSYGEGISTVVKALADAHELLVQNGTMVIRDMVLYEYMSKSDLMLEKMMKKVKQKEELVPLIDSFEGFFGKIDNIWQLNHFLLKYMYKESWEREGKECYVPISFEQYSDIFKLLGMKILFLGSSTIPYLKDKWKSDFFFSDEELENFRSTGIIVTFKNSKLATETNQFE